MITIKSIADERLDFALDCIQEVINKTECYLSVEGIMATSIHTDDDQVINEAEDYPLAEEYTYTPAERKSLDKGKPSESDVAKNYHQYIKSFGMLMLNNGLVAALLFAQGKANKGDNKAKAYKLIISHLTCWLKQREFIADYNQQAIVELFNKNGSDIRTITREALSFLEDLKRVADARFYKPE